MALSRVAESADAGKNAAIQRALSWTLGMQSQNGGWGAFDKNNTKTLIAKIDSLVKTRFEEAPAI